LVVTGSSLSEASKWISGQTTELTVTLTNDWLITMTRDVVKKVLFVSLIRYSHRSSFMRRRRRRFFIAGARKQNKGFCKADLVSIVGL